MAQSVAGLAEAGEDDGQAAYRIAVGCALGRLQGFVSAKTARDVAHDIGVGAWRAWKDTPGLFEDPSHLEKWINKRVSWRLVDRLRAAARKSMEESPLANDDAAGSEPDPLDQLAGPDYEMPDQAFDYRELNRVLSEPLGRLSREKREVFLRIRRDGLTPQEVADERKIALATVKFHVATTLAALRAAMVKAYGYAPEIRNSGGWDTRRRNAATEEGT